jgi:hypothetical protein
MNSFLLFSSGLKEEWLAGTGRSLQACINFESFSVGIM